MHASNLKKKDQEHFATGAENKRPLETKFRRLDFKPLVSGTFGETSTDVKVVVDMVLEYGVEHLGRTLASTTVDAFRATLRRRYRTYLAVTVWRGYANLILDMIKYVGTGHTAPNMAQVKTEMHDMADAGEFEGVSMAHDTDLRMPSPMDGGTLG